MSDAPTTPSAIKPAVSGEQLRLVLDVSRTLAVTSDLDILLTRIARATTELLGCERASVFLHDARRNELWTTVIAFTSNQTIHCADAYGDSRFNPEPDRRSGFLSKNLLAAPMVDCDGKPVGVLQAINKCSGTFSETDIALLGLLSDQAGVAIQRWNLQQEAIQALKLKHEMYLARAVQEAMIPKNVPALPCRPASTAATATTSGAAAIDSAYSSPTRRDMASRRRWLSRRSGHWCERSARRIRIRSEFCGGLTTA
jgi:phosphoserine phosphatase